MSHFLEGQRHTTESDAGDNGIERICAAAMRLVSVLAQPPVELKLRDGSVVLEMSWPVVSGPHGVPAAEAAMTPDTQQDPAMVELVRAPLIGTFYRASEPGTQPFVSIGDMVEVGQQIGIVESMKLMNVIESEVSGRVVEILVTDATPVEFDQPLIALAPPEDTAAYATFFPNREQVSEE